MKILTIEAHMVLFLVWQVYNKVRLHRAKIKISVIMNDNPQLKHDVCKSIIMITKL